MRQPNGLRCGSAAQPERPNPSKQDCQPAVAPRHYGARPCFSSRRRPAAVSVADMLCRRCVSLSASPRSDPWRGCRARGGVGACKIRANARAEAEVRNEAGRPTQGTNSGVTPARELTTAPLVEAIAAVGLVQHPTTPSAKPLARRATRRNDSGQERRTDVPRAPQAEFRQGLGREATEAPQLTPTKPAFTRHSSRPSPSLPNVSQVEAIDSGPRAAAARFAGISSVANQRDPDAPSLYLRIMTPIRDRSPPNEIPANPHK
jgi:hypothetical protein